MLKNKEGSTPPVPEKEDLALTPLTTGQATPYTTPVASPGAATTNQVDDNQTP